MSKSCDASVAAGDLSPGGFEIARDGPGRLRLFGELDMREVPRVRARLVGADGDLELDCAGVTFIDAAGVRLFVELRADCDARRATLRISNPSRCVVRLLELTALDSVFLGAPEGGAQ
jgi:anti-anti-sigma factor